MSRPTLTIGQIVLQDFEVPNCIRFGGEQRLVVHRLADGTRSIEPLGPDEAEIRFGGYFVGVDAEIRAQAVDGMRIAGSVVALRWQTYSYRVIIRSFQFNYRSPWWIAYQISCIVANQFVDIVTAQPTLASTIATDISVAAAAVPGLASSLISVSASTTANDALIAGTTANAVATLATQNTVAALDQQIAQQSQIVGGYSDAGMTVQGFTASLGSEISAASQLASAVTARGYLRRVGLNLQTGGNYQ